MNRVFTTERVLTAANSETIAVDGTDVVYTRSFDVSGEQFFGASALASSGGTVNVKIELEQSFQPPTTEGAADDNWAVPDNTDILATVVNTTVRHFNLQPIPLRYLRFKITGLAGNDSTTSLTMKLSKQG